MGMKLPPDDYAREVVEVAVAEVSERLLDEDVPLGLLGMALVYEGITVLVRTYGTDDAAEFLQDQVYVLRKP